jgi:hypothetical protein
MQQQAVVHVHRFGAGDAGIDVVPPAVAVPWSVRLLRLRVWLRRHVVRNRWFDRLVLLVIIANSVFLALDNPRDSEDSDIQRVIAVSENVRARARAGLGVRT